MSCAQRYEDTVYGSTIETLKYSLRDFETDDLVTWVSGTITIIEAKTGAVLIDEAVASGTGTDELYWQPAWGADEGDEIPAGTVGELLVKWTAIADEGTQKTRAFGWRILAP